jgi:hypothetical protein
MLNFVSFHGAVVVMASVSVVVDGRRRRLARPIGAAALAEFQDHLFAREQIAHRVAVLPVLR